ncbi:hypothetical protein SLA2020_314220 [Shorea laevis]
MTATTNLPIRSLHRRTHFPSPRCIRYRRDHLPIPLPLRQSVPPPLAATPLYSEETLLLISEETEKFFLDPRFLFSPQFLL